MGWNAVSPTGRSLRRSAESSPPTSPVSANHWLPAHRSPKFSIRADIFVDWYIPNERFLDPKIGNDVIVIFGRRRIAGTIMEILPVSDVYAGRQRLVMRDRPATQIARIRFSANAVPPALNATVYVHMHYSDAGRLRGDWLTELLGLQ